MHRCRQIIANQVSKEKYEYQTTYIEDSRMMDYAVFTKARDLHEAQKGPVDRVRFAGQQLGDLDRTISNSVLITVPKDSGAGRKAPVLVFFNGWQGRADWYRHIINRIASKGFACVQYDYPTRGQWLLVPGDIRLEAEHFAKLLKWLEHINETRQLKTQLDLDRLALGGHSRGGSLACHVYLQTPSLIKAVYLLDPVDDDADGAIEKLGKLREKPRLGITGVGVTSGFNPRSRNFWRFMDVGAEGSQLHVLLKAKHLQFCDGGRIWNSVLALLDTFPEWFTKPSWAGSSVAGALSTDGEATIKKLLEFGDTEREAAIKSMAMDMSGQATETSRGQAAQFLKLNTQSEPGEEGRVGEVKKVCKATAAAMLAWLMPLLKVPCFAMFPDRREREELEAGSSDGATVGVGHR